MAQKGTEEMNTVRELQIEAHRNSVEKGFWDGHQNLSEKIMLIVTELSEAIEALRTRRRCFCVHASLLKISPDQHFIPLQQFEPDHIHKFESDVKDTFEDELADAAIRLFDLAESQGIDLQMHIELKMSYNRTRDAMHGKDF